MRRCLVALTLARAPPWLALARERTSTKTRVPPVKISAAFVFLALAAASFRRTRFREGVRDLAQNARDVRDLFRRYGGNSRRERQILIPGDLVIVLRSGKRVQVPIPIQIGRCNAPSLTRQG